MLKPILTLGFSCTVAFMLASTSWQEEAKQSTEVANSEEEFTDAQLEFFESKVRPLLVEHCYDCHGPDAEPPEGGLSLVSRKAIMVGGDSGPGIDLDDLADSNILTAVEYGDFFEMPPDSKLSDQEVAIFRKWVMDKAPWPAATNIDVDQGEQFDLAKRKAEHWCWQTITSPDVPNVQDEQWPLDPIDNFILEKLEQAELKPAAATDKATWLRRVTFDITGLPPTPSEIKAFLDDDSSEAYESVVDRLLNSPRYGERWTRHWMDLIRYAETCGHEFDYPIPHAFRYRDYLIRAFNDDVPYDQFLTEHVAGDLMDEPRRHPDTQTNESILGTGYWFLGEATHAPVDVKGDEAGRVDNQIDVFGKTFLGLTIACARCHDHKFDAISAKDYYGIAGFLQSSRRQNVMLDPNGKIQAATQEAEKQITKLATAYQNFTDHLDSDDPYFQDYSKYMQASIEFLQGHDGWKDPTSRKIEGEALAILEKTAGDPKFQEIGGWSGDKQLWWTGASTGDTLDLGFSINETNRYRLAIRLTTAGDYGIVQVSVDGKNVGDPIDLYSNGVKRTEEISLGSFDFEKGQQTLQLKIIGANEKAHKAFTAGIDYITLTTSLPEEGQVKAESRRLEFCEKLELDDAILKRWIAAMKDPALKNANHPFHLLRLAAESDRDLRSIEAYEFFGRHYNRIKSQMKANLAWQDGNAESSPQFEPNDWRLTGGAFDYSRFDFYDTDNQIAVAANQLIKNWKGNSAQIHSGLLGRRFQGVARSPTFTIETEAIHYLAAGANAQIRLIVDGFVMNEYNPLLFADLIKNVDTDGKWQWIEQRGDLKKHIGHKAYIEVIDQGGGFIAIKDIRFDDKRRPNQMRGDSHAMFPRLPDCNPWTDTQDFTRTPLGIACNLAALSARISNTLPHSQAIIDTDLFNWVTRHRLIPIEDKAYDSLEESLSQWKSTLKKLNDTTPKPQLAVAIADGTPETEFIFIRGNHKNLGEKAERAPITALRDATDWQTNNESSGRIQLAQNMLADSHPLTRRVIVNRIWHHLTGRGLVHSVDNFGVLGSEPSHPELLDYLSTEFSNDGWSVKKMIRRIVLSQTYRMGSSSPEDASTKDPENVLLHKFRIRRLQGEAIRDSLLTVSGRLDEKMYGPSVPVYLTSFMQGRGRPGKSGPLDGNGRRSVYIEVRRNFLSPMMLAFDTPIPFNAIGRRNQSNVPAQALILMNDPFVLQQAKLWAERLLREHSIKDERLKAAVLMVTGREANENEIKQLLAFIETQKAAYEESVDEVQLWTDVCHVLFNLKEFIYVK